MAVPNLANGVLPRGVHDCTLTEAQSAFGHGNPHPRRADLWQGLLTFLQVIQPICGPDKFHTLYIDGSYTTDKEAPNDIDIVLEAALPGSRAVRVIQNHGLLHILDEVQTQTMYGLHVFVAFPNDGPWIKFFQRIKPAEAQQRGMSPQDSRGILRVRL